MTMAGSATAGNPISTFKAFFKNWGRLFFLKPWNPAAARVRITPSGSGHQPPVFLFGIKFSKD
jgi:hypothetical protein